MRSVTGRWGETWFYHKDRYIGPSLQNYGEFSPEETEKIISLASGLCLDIGANFGCIGQALEASGFNVVAFEPQPDVYKLTCKNIRKGVVHNCGLGDVEGTAQMTRIRKGSRASYGSSAMGVIDNDEEPITVPVHTLDSFNLNPGFMKIDVEGYEEKVLRGAVETILKWKPIMYIEDDRREKSLSLRTFIRSLGYGIAEHNPPLYRDNNFFGKKRNIFDSNYISNNLICTPC